ncbi:transcriptional adapter 2 [Trichomonascus vanleenenianus]|uniref:chromatin-binding transcription regulator ADA2 n=1 Tax=Trichomonascus vanleenenianus TaxID=2268995 RepID=UPI003ECAC080
MTVIHRKNAQANPLKATEPGVKFHCDICSCDCTNLVRIRCAQCTDYDLCVQCFAQGSSSGNHKPWHDYMIVEQHAYPIFEEDWGADEELLLIEGAESQGLGNWQDIADHIGGRSKEEVDAHYRRVYLDSPYYPLPAMNKRFSITAAEFAEKKRQRLEKRKTLALQLPLPKQKPTASVPACHEVQGFMPGRLEFEAELENEAETTVKDMVFEPEDNEQDIELKLTVLDIYNSRLTARAERKRAIFKHKLLNFRKNAAIEKKRSKEERDLMNKVRPFARIMTDKDFDDFSESVMSEFHTRRRIAELQEYRRAGLRNLDQAAKYERDKANRLNALARTGAIPQTLLLPPSRHGPDSLEVAAEPVNTTPGIANNVEPKIKSEGEASNGGSITNINNNGKVTNYDYNNGSDRKWMLANGGFGSSLDISNTPDCNLLSEDEKQLCSYLRIYPKPYIAIKEALFRRLLQNGGSLKLKDIKESLKLDPNKSTAIFEFFKSQGWMS